MQPRFRNRNAPTVDTLNQDVADFTEEFDDGVIGKLLGLFTVGTADTAVPHGLGAKPLAWWPYSPQGPGVVYESPERSPDRHFLYLRASVEVIVGIRVV